MKFFSIFFILVVSPFFLLAENNQINILESSNMDKLEIVIKDKLINDISIDKSKIEKIEINRIYDSELFSVSIDSNHYIVTSDGKYWINSAFSNVFKVDGNVENVNVSNSDRENLLLLTGLLAETNGGITVSSESYDYQKSVFAFVDVSCPHCKEFHLRKLGEWNRQGVRVYFIPFMRDPGDKKTKSIMDDIFCADKNSERLDLMLSAYINIKAYTIKGNAGTCGHRRALLDSLYRIGMQYSLKGSPMFMNMVGDVYYGSASYEVAEIQTKKGMK